MGLLEKLGLERTAALRTLAPGVQPTAPAATAGSSTAGVPKIDLPNIGDSIRGTKLADSTQDFLEFSTARNDLAVLLATLNAHTEKASVQSVITAATGALTKADAHAAKGEYNAGKHLVDQALTLCRVAKDFADDAAKYKKELAIVAAQINSLKRVLPPEVWNPLITQLNGVIAAAPTSAANLKAAGTLLATLRASIATQIKTELDAFKARLAGLEALDAKVKAYVAADLANAKKFMGEAVAALAASEWSRCTTSAKAAGDVIAPTERIAARRGAYESQRAPLVAAISALKPLPAVKDRATELEAKVAQADALAARDSMEFEQAIRQLKEVGILQGQWATLAPVIGAYTTERPLADADLKALKAHPAVAKLGEAMVAITAQLDNAAKSAALAKTGNDPVAAWSTALTSLRRARADLAQAKTMGDGLAPVLTAKSAAGDPKNLDALRQAVKSVTDEADSAKKAPHADVASAELTKATTHAAKATAALAKNDGTTAAAQLKPAAEALLAAKAIQAEHAQFATGLTALEARKTKIDALPTKASIKGRIDAVQKALDDARAQDKAHNAAAAMAVLRRGEDAAVTAEKAHTDRIRYNTEATRVKALVAAVSDAKARAPLDAALADATSNADVFQFPQAEGALKKIELKVDTITARAMIGKSPPDPNLAKVAARMVANGGATDVDDMLQSMPDSGEPAAAAALIAGRHGITFTPDGGPNKADEMRSVKLIGKTLSKIPNDIKDNPSIKGITHTDTTGDGEGAYDPQTATFSMKGRKSAKPQEFGAKQKFKVGTKMESVLPKVDRDCEPIDDTPVPVLAWTALHEAAHGIDDAHAYMKQNGDKPHMGGWKSHGSSLKEIADVVGPEFGLYGTPEEKKYVLEKILSMDPPSPSAGTGDWAVRKKNFDDWYDWATSEGSYMVQSQCEKWTIKSNKRIYHEAYGRVWVSYDAAARKKGLTGYQFRAPGEWFSELYAGYKSGKLGSKHPALGWLTKVSKK